MDGTLLIAAIAAGSALLGSIVPTLIGIWSSERQQRFEVKKYLLDHQQAAYLRLLDVMQSLFNDQSNHDLFRDFQKAVSRVAMFGDKAAANACQSYYSDLVSQSQGCRGPVSATEHQAHQLALLNAMRMSMDLEGVDQFALVSYLPPVGQRA